MPLLHRFHLSCIIRITMPTAAILGCRRLHRPGDARPACSPIPELEPVALGSDSLAGQPAHGARPAARTASLPRFVAERRGGARAAPTCLLCLANERGGRASTPPDGAVVVDLSGAHRLADDVARRAVVRFGTRRRRRDWSYGAARAAAADGPADREPGLLRDRGAARARAARATSIDRRRSSSTRSRACSGAGRSLERDARIAGAVLENLTPYASARHRHAPEIEQELGFAPSLRAAPAARPPRPARDLLRAHGRLGDVRAAARGGVRRLADVVRVLPEGVVPEIARVQGTDARRARRLRRPRRRGTDDRDLRDRQPRQGRRRPGDAEREPRARPAARRRACGCTGCCV